MTDSGYTLVPVEGNPFAQQPPSAYDLVPAQGNPFQPNEPNGWANTWTGIARGVGSLLDKTGQAELIAQQAPQEVTPPPGAMAASTINSMTNGSPYQPTTDFGRLYQNGVANFTEGLPMAAMGGGGVPGLIGRLAASAGSAAGGELGAYELPDHPLAGRVAGSFLGGAFGGGISPRVSTPPTTTPVTDIFGEVVGHNIVPPAQQSPGLISRAASGVMNQYNKMIPEEYRFIAPLLAGEKATGEGGIISKLLQYAMANPYIAAGVGVGLGTTRGYRTNPAQTMQGTGAGLLPAMSDSNY